MATTHTVGTAPILILGPHRAGTSLTARMLGEIGVFLGARVDQNAESTYFQRLNRNLLNEIGAHWSTPVTAVSILEERARSAARLTALGAQVIDAPPGKLSGAITDAYLNAKSRGRI